MANHCTEVYCSNCGASYCLRGCNHGHGPTGRKITPSKYDLKVKGEICKYCKKESLYHD